MKIYCTIVSVVKYREIFQVYNNTSYTVSDYKFMQIHIGPGILDLWD